MSAEAHTARDKALVERAKADPEAFGAIFDIYYGPILSYALRRTGDPALAEDVVAETFVKALKNLWRFRWQGVPLSAWLYRIAGNELKMHGRKKRAVSLEALQDQGFDVADEQLSAEREALEAVLAQDAQYARVVHALRSLKPRYQEAIALRYMEEKEFSEIAQIMNTKEGTVRSLISRGIADLRRTLELQQSDPESITTSEGRSVLSITTQNLL